MKNIYLMTIGTVAIFAAIVSVGQSASASESSYTVKSGDTLWSISREHNIELN